MSPSRRRCGASWTALRPRLYETFAIVHRPEAELSTASRVVVSLAAERMRHLNTAVRGA